MSEDRIEKLKELLEKNPRNALIHYGIANEYFKLELWEKAVEAINSYLELKDDEGAAYRMLGHCYIELGMRTEAKRAYENGGAAAARHGHPDMAEEFGDYIESMDK